LLATTNEKLLYELVTVAMGIFTPLVVTVGIDKGGMAETFEETTDDWQPTSKLAIPL
jgi:hypothetical protein